MSTPADQAPAAPAPASPSGSPAEKGDVSEVVKQLEQKFEARLQAQSQIIGTLQNALKKQEPATPPAADPLTDRIAALEARDKKAAEREAAQKEREALTAIKAGLVKSGVDPAQADRFAKLTLLEHRANIVVDDDFNVTIKEGDKQTPVATWCGAFVQTEQGRVFLPPVQNPSVKTGGSSNSGKTKVTRADLQAGKYDAAAWKAGQLELVD